MDKDLDKLNEAIGIIRSFCDNFGDCEHKYCPFYVNCPFKGNTDAPSCWEEVDDDEDDIDDIGLNEAMDIMREYCTNTDYCYECEFPYCHGDGVSDIPCSWEHIKGNKKLNKAMRSIAIYCYNIDMNDKNICVGCAIKANCARTSTKIKPCDWKRP